MVLGLDESIGMLERLFDLSVAIARQREDLSARIAEYLKKTEGANADQTLRTIKNRLSVSEAMRVYRYYNPDASPADARKYVDDL